MNKVRNQIKEVIRKESYIKVLGCFTAVFILSSLGFLLSCSNRPCDTDADCTPEQPICVPLEADPTLGVCKCITNADCPPELPTCIDGVCVGVTCGVASAPTCDGTCPPEQVCIVNNFTDMCGCAPDNSVCGTAIAPACNTECSPGRVCVEEFPGRCGCVDESLRCNVRAGGPTCDAKCSSGRECVITSGDDCMCVDSNVACGEASSPECAGVCPSGQACILQGESCECVDEIELCHATYPICGGICPTGEDCTGGALLCVCVPSPTPSPSPSPSPPATQCGDTFPTCNGACPTGEACLFGSAGCMCVSGPPSIQCGDTFPVCNGACPSGEACLFGSAGCMCAPGPISLSALQATSSSSTHTYGENPNPSFILGSNSPGQSPSHTLSFDVAEGELETYMAVVTYPGAFMFNGFGAINMQIGTFGLDVDFDGIDDIIFSIRGVDGDTAYADVSLDGTFTPGVDPTIEYTTGSNIFTTILPFGGDGNPNTLEALLSARVTLMLNSGILTSPNTPGKYTLTGDFTSVDPDNDGANDDMNNSPLTFSADLVVKIADIEVEIDIKPGGNPNSINLKSKGVIPVAILTTATFNARNVNAMSVKFGPEGATEAHGKGHLEDVDGDGDIDMVLHFRTQSTGITAGDSEACLIGETMAGTSILGCDSIKTVP